MYSVKDESVSPEDFVKLRKVTGLTPRPIEAVRLALPNSLYAVSVYDGDTAIGMGRAVGDGVLNIEIVDIAVLPEYQGKGIGTLIMERIMNYIDSHAHSGAYITLMADVPALYQKFGFAFSRPRSEGMYLLKK